ncbi:MAG: RNA polymerase sigma factor [Thermoleophilaceae bacterium]
MSSVHGSRPPAREWDWAGLRSRCLREARRVLPSADAEEAVQEALLRAWRRRHACRTPHAPLPWVLEITRNEARRLLDQRSRRMGHELVERTPQEPLADDAELAGAATRVTVERALRRLDDTDRQVLRLRYDEDLTQPEVAHRLDLPEGTVKVRLHRARHRLREMLDESP